MRVFKDEDGLRLEVDRDLERLMHSVQASVRQARNRALLLFIAYFDLFQTSFDMMSYCSALNAVRI